MLSHFPPPVITMSVLGARDSCLLKDRVNYENHVLNPFDTHLCLLLAISVFYSLKCK